MWGTGRPIVAWYCIANTMERNEFSANILFGNGIPAKAQTQGRCMRCCCCCVVDVRAFLAFYFWYWALCMQLEYLCRFVVCALVFLVKLFSSCESCPNVFVLSISPKHSVCRYALLTFFSAFFFGFFFAKKSIRGQLCHILVSEKFPLLTRIRMDIIGRIRL